MGGIFEAAGGSVMGRHHQRSGTNNQDAWQLTVDDAIAIAVVCDGCGSGRHSEVGAKLGAVLMKQVLYHQLSMAGVDGEVGPDLRFWQGIQAQLLAQLELIALTLGDRTQLVRTIYDYLLFTIVGAIATPQWTQVFTLGDGVLVLNGEVLALPKYANNAPPYVAYGLLGGAIANRSATELQFNVHRTMPTAAVESLLVGTDGVNALMAAADQPLPGREEAVGAIAQFWDDDRYFKNPDRVRRRLALVNRTVTHWHDSSQQRTLFPGLLNDDTTLIVWRKPVFA